MIKLFRNIRQKLLQSGKLKSYTFYAIGEIFLVVIGILIALQINNWNESKKERQSMKMALNSLIADLKQDSIQIKNDLKNINADIAKLENFKIRLSQKTANIDTLRKIARYEYLPFFNPSNEVNRNTIVSLLSTGNLDFFDDKIKNDILKHNSKQLSMIKVMDENVRIFLSVMTTSGSIFLSEHELFDIAVIRGPLLDSYWKDFNDNELTASFLKNLSHKKMMQTILSEAKETLYNSTMDMINILQSYQATL